MRRFFHQVMSGFLAWKTPPTMRERGASRELAAKAREAREEIVTVMFVDIVGFSAASLAHTPAETFRALKSMFQRITGIVHGHGGIVDRTLGDGLLAYFTARDGAAVPGGHADRALACAVAILQAQIEAALKEDGGHFTAALPFRIGVNSGSVYRGDLGDEGRRDDTIIGNTVNFGQRLESACEMNRIMIGEKTMELATRFSEATVGLRRRPIIAKNHQEPVNAFEFDPFAGDAERTRRFVSVYQKTAHITRTEERWDCEGASLVMATSHGYARVVNVSRSGVMLRFEQYIARGAAVYVSQVIAPVEHLDVPPLFLEVRWGFAESDRAFLHGCLVKSLSEEQKAELWEIWRCAIARAKGCGSA